MGNKKAKKKSTKEIVSDKFFAFLDATSLKGSREGRDHIHVAHSYGRNCLLLGWRHQPFEEAIQAVHEARPMVSKKTIGKILSQSMVKLFHQHNVGEDADPEADAPIMDSILETLDSTAVSEEVNNILDLLKSHIKSWIAFVFIEGIELKGIKELSLGDATLYVKDHGPLVGALEDVKGFKNLDISQSIEEYASHCHCYLTINIEGESKFIDYQALRQAQDIINVLSLYLVSTSQKESSYERIGFLGQPTFTRSQIVFKRTHSIGENEESEYSFSEQFSPSLRKEITSTTVQQWRENGLDKILECIGQPDTKFGTAEMRIRNAITWYGRAMNAYTQDEQFVGLTIALESLLVADEKVIITQRLADEISGLLGGNFQNRESIRERVKELYNLRSRIVHSGISVSQENLQVLNNIVVNTILAFVSKEVPNS